jgi:hypothetical protein
VTQATPRTCLLQTYIQYVHSMLPAPPTLSMDVAPVTTMSVQRVCTRWNTGKESCAIYVGNDGGPGPGAGGGGHRRTMAWPALPAHGPLHGAPHDHTHAVRHAQVMPNVVACCRRRLLVSP